MRVRSAVFFGFSVAVLAIIGVAYAMPPTDDFGLENPFWNGCSKLDSRVSAVAVSDLERLSSVVLNPSDSVVLVLGPSQPFTEGEADGVRVFMEAGGRVVLAEDFGTGNDLLEKLGVEVRFSGLMMLDPLFKDRDSRVPKVLDFTSSTYTSGLSALTFNYATVLVDVEAEGRVLAYSTLFSYVSEDPNAAPEDVPVGSFPVMAEVKYSDGALVLISDSSVFINCMIDRDDNGVLLKNLVSGRGVYVDVSHWRPALLTQFKGVLAWVYGVAGVTEVKYVLMGVVAVVIFRFRWRGREVKAERGEVEEALKGHSEWDRTLLERLKRLRGEHGVK